MTPPRFVVDTMLGRLARWLRAMGYDTLYPGSLADGRLLEVALAEDRILLTRDGMLARQAGSRGCLIRAVLVEDQLVEAIRTLALTPPDGDWLSRCLHCNEPLESRDRPAVRGRVPERVFATRTEFRGCPRCRRIYWWGSHADRITTRLGRLLRRLTPVSHGTGDSGSRC